MIVFENIETFGFEAAVRGMRNPLNSWNRSDSYWKDGVYFLGENDLKLMKNLIKAGTDHSKFMRMIGFSCDITAPLYFAKEHDTYKVGTVRNSCSTMHKIQAQNFDLSMFSHEKLSEQSISVLQTTIQVLNSAREEFLKTKDKDFWWQMIQLLPSSYNQRYTWQANYAVLQNIYAARSSHKLDEWKDFCKMIEGLPYSELITKDFD